MSSDIVEMGLSRALAGANQGEQASREEIIAFLEKLADTERAVRQAATDLAALIDARVATCEQITEYTQNARRLFVVLGRTKEALAASNIETPPIPFPAFFTREGILLTLIDKWDLDPGLAVVVPGCADTGRPNYDTLREFVPEDLPQSVVTTDPAFGPVAGGLGDLDFAWFVWGAVVIGSILATTAAIIIIDPDFLKSETVRLEEENSSRFASRINSTWKCFVLRLAGEPDASSERRTAIHNQCVETAERLIPAAGVPKKGGFFGTAVKIVAVGAGGWFTLRFARKKGWV